MTEALTQVGPGSLRLRTFFAGVAAPGVSPAEEWVVLAQLQTFSCVLAVLQRKM